ncbi:MAG: hypothetical protein JRJ29_07530 [Deltaproteobacteria bacterium]|nr:hypothetical protein [Deltaproteobacteria bacterium]
MDKDHDKAGGKASRLVPPREVINEVIQSIESVDKKLERFFEIHGTELQVPYNNQFKEV